MGLDRAVMPELVGQGDAASMGLASDETPEREEQLDAEESAALQIVARVRAAAARARRRPPALPRGSDEATPADTSVEPVAISNDGRSAAARNRVLTSTLTTSTRCIRRSSDPSRTPTRR